MEHDNCRHLIGSLSEYVDGVLQEELCAELERHLAGCPKCRVVVDTLNKTISLYHQSAARAAPPAEVRQRLYRRLNLSDFLEK